MHESFRIYEAISKSNAYALLEYFDNKIEIRDHCHGGKIHKGSKEALLFFEEFFSEYKIRSDRVLIFCRFMNKYGCTPMLDKLFKEYCASHDFFIYLEEEKISRIDVFSSINQDMQFFMDDEDIDLDEE